MRIFVVTFLVYCLFSFSSIAHQFSPANAELKIFDQTSISLEVDFDLIELTQQQLALTGKNGDELLQQTQNLSKTELFKLFTQVKQQLKSELKIKVNDESYAFDAVYAPDVAPIYVLLQHDNGQITHRVQFYASLQVEKPINSIAVFFPDFIGSIQFKLSTTQRSLLSSGELSPAFSITTNQQASQFALKIDTALSYLYQGIVHIVPLGVDHILFVLALFLLARSVSALLWQVSAFTLAHTLTLGLGLLGIIQINPTIVEPLIALSIVYVAIENIYLHHISRWRIALVFGFGLLHGLGFASALKELGVPDKQWLLSLVSFNIGVELGQLLVICASFAILFYWRKQPYYQHKVVTPISILISLVAGYWFIERLGWF